MARGDLQIKGRTRRRSPRQQEAGDCTLGSEGRAGQRWVKGVVKAEKQACTEVGAISLRDVAVEDRRCGTSPTSLLRPVNPRRRLNLTRTTASEVPRPEVCQYRSRPLSCDQRRAELKLLSLIVASMMLFALMV